ncbi:MAG: hypothetical protein NVS9B5_36900 [Terriglobales bacterium]
MKDPFAKVSISFDRNLLPGGITIDALCKSTPSQLLRYRDTAGELPGRLAQKIPSRRFFGQKPLPAAFTGNLQQEHCSDGRINISINVRQSPHETIKDRVVEIRRHDSGPIGGESDLLLMMPAFRQFASSIKPV